VEHLPVMFAEALQQLDIKKDGVYLDCTFGRGGHSQGILNLLVHQVGCWPLTGISMR